MVNQRRNGRRFSQNKTHSHLRYIHWSGQEVGGHVADEEHAVSFRQEVVFHTMNRLVAAVIHIGGWRVQGPAAGVGNFWRKHQKMLLPHMEACITLKPVLRPNTLVALLRSLKKIIIKGLIELFFCFCSFSRTRPFEPKCSKDNTNYDITTTIFHTK